MEELDNEYWFIEKGNIYSYACTDSSLTYYGGFMNFSEILITVWKLLYVLEHRNISSLFVRKLKIKKEKEHLYS